jgi:hypothetical protein
MDPIFYNSEDPEFKYLVGPLIAVNTIACDNYMFSYSVNTKAFWVSDQSNVLIIDLLTVVNGLTTTGDYISIFTANFKDSPYIVNVKLTVTHLDFEWIFEI